jgi:hypothetical protein
MSDRNQPSRPPADDWYGNYGETGTAPVPVERQTGRAPVVPNDDQLRGEVYTPPVNRRNMVIRGQGGGGDIHIHDSNVTIIQGGTSDQSTFRRRPTRDDRVADPDWALRQEEARQRHRGRGTYSGHPPAGDWRNEHWDPNASEGQNRREIARLRRDVDELADVVFGRNRRYGHNGGSWEDIGRSPPVWDERIPTRRGGHYPGEQYPYPDDGRWETSRNREWERQRERDRRYDERYGDLEEARRWVGTIGRVWADIESARNGGGRYGRWGNNGRYDDWGHGGRDRYRDQEWRDRFPNYNEYNRNRRLSPTEYVYAHQDRMDQRRYERECAQREAERRQWERRGRRNQASLSIGINIPF